MPPIIHGPLARAPGFGFEIGAYEALLAVAGLALLLGAVVLSMQKGRPFSAALIYLALAGSVLTFACFLTLQERIGPGPTASIGVMTPLLALVVSVAFEDFRPDVLTIAGAALAVTGNVLMLKRA